MATISLVSWEQGETTARGADPVLVLLPSFKYICKHPPCTDTKGGSGEVCVLMVIGF